MGLHAVDFGNGTSFAAGESGNEVKVKDSAAKGMCGGGGKATKKALETELKLDLNKSKLSLEVLQTDWSVKVTLDVPNDTVTHRARNAYGLYRNMPGGRSLKCELLLSKVISAERADCTVAVQLKAGGLAWYHNPLRSYGPFGERGGPFVKTASLSSSSSCARFIYDTPTEAAAFAQSLVNARAKPTTTAGSSGENASPQNRLLPLEGKSFVFTGNGANRETLEEQVAALGGKVTSAVSGKTSFLVAYDRSTTKYKKATELRAAAKPGPQIIDEAEMRVILDDARAVRTSAAAQAVALASSTEGGGTEPDLKRQRTEVPA